jgi:polyisoprenoid-binding protein YceI
VRERFELDPAHTVLGFSAKHLGVTTVRGSFWRLAGWFEADRDNPVGARGEVAVEVGSIVTGQEQRDAHLRSADFFDTERHPTMTFRLTGVRPRADDTYLVLGDLTIKQTTRPITLQATLEGETADPAGAGSRIGISATGQLDRMDFGLDWDGLAGAVPFAGHTVKLEIDAELIAAPASPAATETVAGLEALIESLGPRELADLRRALDRAARAVDDRLEPPAPPAGRGGGLRRILGRFGRGG